MNLLIAKAFLQFHFLKNIDKIDFSNYDYVLLADEYIKDTSVNYDIEDLDAQSKIAIIIGPEGGISENERSLLLQKNQANKLRHLYFTNGNRKFICNFNYFSKIPSFF